MKRRPRGIPPGLSTRCGTTGSHTSRTSRLTWRRSTATWTSTSRPLRPPPCTSPPSRRCARSSDVRDRRRQAQIVSWRKHGWRTRGSRRCSTP
eukprot:7823130-Pyramimonas_sp.AAC.1